MLAVLSSVIVFTVCCVFFFCSRIESLQKKHRKLQNDKNSAIQFTRLMDSLLESDLDTPAQLSDKHKPVIRNSCPLTSSSSSAQLPALSEFKSASRYSHSAGVLPLPVQNVNLEMMDSNNVIMSQCGGGSDVTAVTTCSTSSFTTPGSVSCDSSLLTAAVTCLPVTQPQVPLSINALAHRLPKVSSASHNSASFLYSRDQPTALMPANGLVIPVTAGNSVLKTSLAQTQSLVRQTLQTSSQRSSVIVALSTSTTTNNVRSSGKPTSVTSHSGQFVHLTIPTMLNLTGTNIQIRQFVSVPPRTCTVSSCGSVSVCSATGLSTVPCRMVSVACSQPIETVTTTDSDSIVPRLLQQGDVSFQSYRTPSELQSTLVSCSHVMTSDTLSTQLRSSNSVDSRASVDKVAVNCSTPPACHDEESRLDSMSCDVDASQMCELHARIIPNIPTPDPSCSSQE